MANWTGLVRLPRRWPYHESLVQSPSPSDSGQLHWQLRSAKAPVHSRAQSDRAGSYAGRPSS